MIIETDEKGFHKLFYKGRMTYTQYLMSNLTVFHPQINPLWNIVEKRLLYLCNLENYQL